MQPPPRKAGLGQELKHTHAEQMNRLHIKHQSECDLLEDLRSFSLKRAAVERDYAQALQKLASQYLRREWPDCGAEDEDEPRTMYCVWRAYLKGSIQVSQARLSSCENYRLQVSDQAKVFRLQKEQRLRKCTDQLTAAQAELQESVKEVMKSRKRYQEAEAVAQAVREKADLDARSRLSLFQSRSSLQRASVKLKAKRSECNFKATHSRNDYLLTLAAANAHQRHYYHSDLVGCIQVLDGQIYAQVKRCLTSLCQVELDGNQTLQRTFGRLVRASSGLLQDLQEQLFIQKNQIFQQPPEFSVQPIHSDSAMQLQRESGTAEEHSLDKEARRWASRVAREYKSVVHIQKTLEEFRTQETSEHSPAELEAKMESARHNLRRAEMMKMKAEARLDLLRQVGVAVETWLKSAMNQVMEELENECWNNLSGHDASLSEVADLEREEEEEDSGEVLDDSSSSPSSTLRSYPLTCKVLYSYKASQPDELSIEEQEILEVIDDGDMEDWLKARKRSGQVGYVPEKYLQLPSSSSLLSMLQALAALDARSHSSPEPEAEPEAELQPGDPSGEKSCAPAASGLRPPAPASACAAASFAKALYDYAGQTQEELSFPEGAVIRILSRDTREDDGFWEGEFNGAVGVFPAVLVEDLSGRLKADGPSGSAQACVSPPARGERACRGPPQTGPPRAWSPSSSAASPTSRAAAHGRQGAPAAAHSPEGPPQDLSRPPRYPGSASGDLRPVRAAPPPPKQHPRGQVKRQEEVEITLV